MQTKHKAPKSSEGKVDAGNNIADSNDPLSLHGMSEIPPGMTVGDFLPIFDGIRHEVHVGLTNQICASCRKPFNAARKPRRAVRMYPVTSSLPVAYSFNICGCCWRSIKQGGPAKDGVLAAVEAYCDGKEAAQ